MRWQTSLALLSVLLSGCDPVENIYVERPNGQPLLCENGQKTEYEVLFAVTNPNNRQEILYEERHRVTVNPRGVRYPPIQSGFQQVYWQALSRVGGFRGSNFAFTAVTPRIRFLLRPGLRERI